MPPITPGHGIKLVAHHPNWENSVKATVLDADPPIFKSVVQMHKWLAEHSHLPNPLAYFKMEEVPLSISDEIIRWHEQEEEKQKSNLSPVLFGSGDKGGSYEWCTPRALFDSYNSWAHYEVDLAASYLNALCPAYIGPSQMVYHEYTRLVNLSKSDNKATREQYRHAPQEFLEAMGCDALSYVGCWAAYWKRAWCNCPYGKLVGDFVEQSWQNITYGMELISLLLPARTDTRWFHKWVLPGMKGQDPWVNVQVDFLPGRVKYELDGQPLDPAPFPSIVIHMMSKEFGQ
jgi:hypothetical protein